MLMVVIAGGPVIKNFDQVKKQLAELSDVVNKFKSEQVQLKIVDLIFRNAGLHTVDGAADEDPEGPDPLKRGGKRGTPSKRKTSAKSEEPGPKKAKARGNGASATLQLLVEKNFFDKKKTIGDVVGYCKNKLARNIRMNNLSGPLARLVREEILDRSKNAENQYEYIKK